MSYRMTIEVTEEEVLDVKEWILEHKSLIINAAMFASYELYLEEFKGKPVLGKYAFNKLCKNILNLTTKVVNICGHSHRIFVVKEDVEM